MWFTLTGLGTTEDGGRRTEDENHHTFSIPVGSLVSNNPCIRARIRVKHLKLTPAGIVCIITWPT
jgi:hypothetical protein